MADVSDGSVSTLPNSSHALPEGTMCDMVDVSHDTDMASILAMPYDGYDYTQAGERCVTMGAEAATDCFWSIAEQHGVVSGEYGSWDLFWIGYHGTTFC